MNFLAHLYLSFQNKDLLIGNFIADAIKGKNYEQYRIGVKHGILLHRQIDSFTDTHPIVKRSMHRLNKRYRHYDGVIIDIFYDHFLAKNWHNYSEIPLDIYATSVYYLLHTEITSFPEKIQYMIPYMIEYNWLKSYSNLKGMERILNGMNKRTQGKSKMNLAIIDLKKHYTALESDFSLFFPELITFVKQQTLEITKL